MSIFGDIRINIDSLKRYVNSFDISKIKNVDIGGYNLEINNELKKMLEVSLDLINEIKEENDWIKCQMSLTQLFYNVFFKIDNISIKIGDFYECLIEASNLKTYKNLIKGFGDFLDIGSIVIVDSDGNTIATIGKKSDFIFEILYQNFINDYHEHLYSNHEEILSIQLFDVENLSTNELKLRVNEILLYISMNYEMDFKVFEANSFIKNIGNDLTLKVEYTPTGFEEIPMFYISNANTINDERFKFLSYYQVIEYFFVRAQNNFFLNELKNINLNKVNHNELRKALRNYKNKSNEKDALKLVLDWAIDITNLKAWINSKSEYINTYCSSTEYKIDLSKTEDKIITKLAERIYGYRCSIAHAKGDVEEYIAIPSISKEKITAELPLVKYLAYEVIAHCSEK
ncbi:hypothetical protein [Fusobacterium hwasookii]|uniref:hypothetical protein n=1 Tax=Fusobacterium hwasookii TaxID=1583098 RepID=UPI0004983433|nr:hypothetical protein [Fusobacterium hwasookii]ALQ37506.1 hypothetical protein RN97_04630 [Fusobacterium hwasookii ChDC F300]